MNGGFCYAARNGLSPACDREQKLEMGSVHRRGACTRYEIEKEAGMAEDIRVRYTKETIEKVFISLLQKKPVEKMTVTEICKLAGINRSTFYKYYMDCYDVAEQMQKQALTSFERILGKISEGDADPERVLSSMLRYIRDSGEGMVVFQNQWKRQIFLQQFVELCYKDIAKWRGVEENASGEDSYLETFIVSGGSGIVAQWIYTDMKEEPEVVARQIIRYSTMVFKDSAAN